MPWKPYTWVVLRNRRGQRRRAAFGLNNHTKQVMENQESKSSWDDLARDLGAEISPEIQQREEAVAHAAPPVSREPEPERETRAPLPKRAATNWNSLAENLGLPPSEEPEPVVPPAPPVSEPMQQERR